MQEYSMRLDNVESVKERVSVVFWFIKAQAATVASETIRKYVSGIVTEVISDSTFKASKILNWRGDEKRRWGSIADAGFKPANYIFDKHNDWQYDMNARDGYFAEAFGVPSEEIRSLAHYAARIFSIDVFDSMIIAQQVIAVEKIVESAFQASQTLNSLKSWMEKPSEPIQGEYHSESFQTEFSDDISSSDESDDDQLERWKNKGSNPGFLESRDETCIFLNCREARLQFKYLMEKLSDSSIKMNRARMAKFLEFKARKEYAMETYGVKLGNLQSLEENALRLIQFDQAQAADTAFKVMGIDYESICFEKIADAAFKASKILNWNDGITKKRRKTWRGNIADASGFKSPKSIKNFCKNMDLEARKAYTMEAFGVSSVEIDYIKDRAITAFHF